MIHNPANIENDLVLVFGRECLDKCLYEENRRAI